MIKHIINIYILILMCALPCHVSGLPGGNGSGQEPRLALIIGNAGYASAPLRNPRNDAQDMAAALKGLGFDTILELDADHQTMISAIREFGRRLRDERGVGLFYFAGHGVQVSGENYLLPIGADIKEEDEIAFEGINANRILEKMDRAANRTNLVILDACRNNPFKRSFRSMSRGLARMNSSSGTLIAFATKPGDVAMDGKGRNGLYTEQLLRHIATPGIDVGLMFRSVRKDVMAETRERQIPWESSSLVDAFYFAPASPTVSAPAFAPVNKPTPSPEVPKTAMLAPAASAPSAKVDLAYWQTIQDSNKCEYFDAYLVEFPNGRFASIAELKRKFLKCDQPDVALSRGNTDERLADVPAYTYPGAPGGAATPSWMEAPPAAESPGSAEEAPNEGRAAISLLLADALDDERDLRLTTPPANNAFERYQRVLALDPGNTEAEAGLERITSLYLRWAQSAIARRDVDKAGAYLDKAAIVDPDSPRIAELRKQLTKPRNDRSNSRRKLAASPEERAEPRVHHKASVSKSPGKARAVKSGFALIAVPKNGRLGSTRYIRSGKEVANLVYSAAATAFRSARMDVKYRDRDDALGEARRLGMEYLVFTTIEHWEDRNTFWSGRPDRASIAIKILRVADGTTVAETSISKSGSWKLNVSDSNPISLIQEPVRHYFARFGGRFRG